MYSDLLNTQTNPPQYLKWDKQWLYVYSDDDLIIKNILNKATKIRVRY